MKKANIDHWDGYLWESGDLAVGLVPQLGGRIMSLKFHGEELLFIQPEHAGETFSLSDLGGNKKEFGFRVWGGDKTWVAPESLWVDKIPPLDLDAGRYSFEADETKKMAVMVSPVCRESGLRIIREIQLREGHRFRLTETMKNETRSPVQRGIWNVTQLLRPVELYFPCKKSDVRLYGDEVYRDCKIENYIRESGELTGILCRDNAHFKFGAQLKDGRVLALRRGQHSTIAASKRFSVIPQARYAHGSHIEVYNSPRYDYSEIEIHSPLLTLEPGQSFSQATEWEFKVFSADIPVEKIFVSI